MDFELLYVLYKYERMLLPKRASNTIHVGKSALDSGMPKEPGTGGCLQRKLPTGECSARVTVDPVQRINLFSNFNH